MDFCYKQPVEIVFGAGARGKLAEVMSGNGYRRAVLIADSVFVKNGVADTICASAPVAAVFSDFGANPDITAADKAVETVRRENADCVVAIGGGSAMDLGKFTALAAACGESAEALFYGELPDKGLPVIAMPATAGTGSEVTGVSVMSDEARGAKKPLVSPVFFPTAAIVDPELTFTVPRSVTAASGLDAIAHALEAYWCRAHNPVSDALAQKALGLLFPALEKVYADGADVAARTDMSLGALLAGMAFAPTRTAAVHACSYPLSEIYHLPHGEACAFTLDLFVRLNSECDPERMGVLSRALGFASPEELAAEIARLKRVTGMRTSLQAIGCTDVATLAAHCAAHPLMNNNPARLSAERLAEEFARLV